MTSYDGFHFVNLPCNQQKTRTWGSLPQSGDERLPHTHKREIVGNHYLKRVRAIRVSGLDTQQDSLTCHNWGGIVIPNPLYTVSLFGGRTDAARVRLGEGLTRV